MNNPRSPAGRTRPVYWLVQVIAWGLYGAANAVAAVVMINLPWRRAAAEMAFIGVLGLALSHALRFFIRRGGWQLLPLGARIPRVFAASLVLGALAGLLTTVLGFSAWRSDELVTRLPALQPFIPFLVQQVNWMLLLAIWSGLYLGALAVRHHKSAELHEAELARALQASELRLLKSQLNPHFLFNALNTVRALIADEPEQAQTAVTRLARMLRYALGAGQGDLVSMQEELTMVEDYLGIEALRLGGRLRIERDISTQTLDSRIPVMLLQTLVENAVKHGIAELPAGGTLRIYAGLAGGALLLEVENACPERLMPAAQDGIGLVNARSRLLLLYGESAALDLDLSRPKHALARVRLSQPA